MPQKMKYLGQNLTKCAGSVHWKLQNTDERHFKKSFNKKINKDHFPVIMGLYTTFSSCKKAILYSNVILWKRIYNIVRKVTHYLFSSVQSLSCVRLFVTPWTAAHQASLSIHEFLEFAQTHVYLVSDAIQPSHPLTSPSPPAFSLSQHQGLFQWDSSSPQVAKVLELQLNTVLISY